MEMISIVEKDEKGQIMGGMKFWHSEGDRIYVYHYWEHMASGPVFSDVMPDPVVSDPEGKMTPLAYTVQECWMNSEERFTYELERHDLNFC